MYRVSAICIGGNASAYTTHKAQSENQNNIQKNDKTAISTHATFSMQTALLCCSWLTNSPGVFLMSTALRIDAM